MEVPGGTVTFLFTDIESSTAMWESQPTEMGAAVARHDAVIRSVVERHEGYVFSTGGDGFGVAFRTAAAAFAAAVAAQRLLAEEPWETSVPLRVRMGLNTGEAQERDGDYFGVPLNRAARTMALAAGGQIVVSDVTASLLETQPHVELVPLGSFELHGVVAPVPMFGVRADGVAPPSARALAARVPDSAAMPRYDNELIGHALDLKLLAGELPAHQLMTLTGPGGVGKTRWAVEIAALAAGAYPDGAWFVDLVPVRGSAAVPGAVATRLALVGEGSPTDALVELFRDKRALLVLDNCEHVVDACASLAGSLTSRCEGLTVLTTSREPLGLHDERVHVVKSLDPSIDGVTLFCDRAEFADADVRFSDDDIRSVAQICERLDGIPLAIELAAARLITLAPAELLARLKDRFRLLRVGPREATERHETLQAAVTWSYQMLDEREQALFERLSVFPSSFDLVAAEVICAGGEVDADDVLDVLTALVRKSLVNVVRGEGWVRYRLLETLRGFGLDRLDERGVTAELRDRHFEHYMDRLAAASVRLQGPDAFVAGEVFSREWDNLRELIRWTTSTADGERLAEAIQTALPYAVNWGSVEFMAWVDAAARAVDDQDPDRPCLLGNAGLFTLLHGDDPPRALELAEAACVATTHSMPPSARALARRLDRLNLSEAIKFRAEDVEEFTCRDTLGFALCLNGLVPEGLDVLRAVTERMAGSPLFEAWARYLDVTISTLSAAWSPDPPSIEACEELLDAATRLHEVARAIGPLFEAYGLHALGAVHLVAGRAEIALDYGYQSVDAAGPMPAMRGAALELLAEAAAVVADDAADRHFATAISELSAMCMRGYLNSVLAALVPYWLEREQMEPAAVLVGHLDALVYVTPPVAGATAALTASATEADVRRWVTRGAQMTRDELVTYVLGVLRDDEDVA